MKSKAKLLLLIFSKAVWFGPAQYLGHLTSVDLAMLAAHGRNAQEIQ